jgi:hypothetical protein
MHRQRLAANKEESIYIPTPAGLIELMRLKNNHWEIRLPGSLRAYKDAAVAVKESPFLEHDGSGAVVPSYNILVPDVDPNTGAIRDCKTGNQAPLRLKVKDNDHVQGQPPVKLKLEALANPVGGR